MSPIRAEHDPNTSQTLYESAPYMGREHTVQEPNANRRRVDYELGQAEHEQIMSRTEVKRVETCNHGVTVVKTTKIDCK